MASLPTNGLKNFDSKDDNGKWIADKKGLDRYFDTILLSLLRDKTFSSIRLADVSPDPSPDPYHTVNFSKFWNNIIERASTRFRHKLPKRQAESLRAMDIVYVIVVPDKAPYQRGNFSLVDEYQFVSPTSNETASSIKTIFSHALECDYPPSMWAKQMFADGCNQDPRLDAILRRLQHVRMWNKRNGGLISANNPEREVRPVKRFKEVPQNRLARPNPACYYEEPERPTKEEKKKDEERPPNNFTCSSLLPAYTP